MPPLGRERRKAAWRRSDQTGTARTIRRYLCAILAFLRWGPRRSATPAERVATTRLRLELRHEIQMPEGTVAPEWVELTERLADLAENDDPRRFFSWDMVQWALASILAPFIWHELGHLRAEPDYARYWRPALKEIGIGRPIPFVLFPATSGKRICLAHHLLMLRKFSDRSVHDFDVVFEFGGGYGGLEVLARALGFEGTYVIVDLPVVRALQRFYLDLAGAPLVDRAQKVLDDKPHAETLLAGLEAVDAIPALLANARRSLFVATWSLSETPEPVRNAVLETLPSFTHVLVSFQQSLGTIDNSAFFESLERHAGPGMQWERIPIDRGERGTPPNNWYAMGKRADTRGR